jgi:hypothetical protein
LGTVRYETFADDPARRTRSGCRTSGIRRLPPSCAHARAVREALSSSGAADGSWLLSHLS